MPWLRWLYWVATIPAYWYCAFRLLGHMSPASVDGGGALETFYWGENEPRASLAEIYQNGWLPFRFFYPYWIAAAIATILGFVAARFQRPGWMAFALFLMAAVAADCGDILDIWHGHRLLYDFRSVMLMFVEFMIPMSLFTRLLAAGGKEINLCREHSTGSSSIDGGAAAGRSA